MRSHLPDNAAARQFTDCKGRLREALYDTVLASLAEDRPELERPGGSVSEVRSLIPEISADHRVRADLENWLARQERKLPLYVDRAQDGDGGVFPAGGLAPEDIGWRGPLIVTRSDAYLVPKSLTAEESMLLRPYEDSNPVLGKGCSSVVMAAMPLRPGGQKKEAVAVAAVSLENPSAGVYFRSHARMAAHLRGLGAAGYHQAQSMATATRGYHVAPVAYFGDLLRLRARLKLGDRQMLSIVREMIGAVSYLLDHHIYHGDIKPENFLMSDDGSVYLTDFEAARMQGAGGDIDAPRLTARDGSLYLAAKTTSLYLDPAYNVSRQQEINTYTVDKADFWAREKSLAVYQLGASIFAIATGRPPLLGLCQATGERMNKRLTVLSGRIDSLARSDLNVPDASASELGMVLMLPDVSKRPDLHKLLAYDGFRRCLSRGELAAELKEAYRPPQAARQVQERCVRPSRRHPGSSGQLANCPSSVPPASPQETS